MLVLKKPRRPNANHKKAQTQAPMQPPEGVVTNYREEGGGGGGGQGKFHPYKKGAGQKRFVMLKGGTKKFEVVLAILMGGRKKGAQKVLPCLERGHKKFWTRDFPVL